MTNLLSPLNQLIQILKDREVAFQDLSKDNIVVVARAISHNTGLDLGEDGFILGTFLMEKEGRWSIVTQAMARYYNEEPGLYSKKNTITLLEAAKGIYVKEFSYLDVDQQLAVEWEVNQADDLKTKAGQSFATIEGTARLGNLPVTDIVTLLESLVNLPEVELVEQSQVLSGE